MNCRVYGQLNNSIGFENNFTMPKLIWYQWYLILMYEENGLQTSAPIKDIHNVRIPISI